MKKFIPGILVSLFAVAGIAASGVSFAGPDLPSPPSLGDLPRPGDLPNPPHPGDLPSPPRPGEVPDPAGILDKDGHPDTKHGHYKRHHHKKD